MSIDERLRRLEEVVAELVERLERLERVASASSPEAGLAVEMALAFTAPVHKIVEAARLVSKALFAGGDDVRGDVVSRAIVEALAVKGPMSLRELEREVRRLRGRASRSTIKERLGRLERLGIVSIDVRGRRWVVRLASEAGEG